MATSSQPRRPLTHSSAHVDETHDVLMTKLPRMTLALPNGESFALVWTGYDYRPATSYETTPRLVLEVEIEGILAEAVVIPVVSICFVIQILPADYPSRSQKRSVRPRRFSFAACWSMAALLAHPDFPADEGEDVTIQTTAFVPDQTRLSTGVTCPVSWGCMGV